VIILFNILTASLLKVYSFLIITNPLRVTTEKSESILSARRGLGVFHETFRV